MLYPQNNKHLPYNLLLENLHNTLIHSYYKKILTYCPNFYKIINFKPISYDELTDKLIRMYKEYIFRVDLNNELDIEKIKNLDEALSKYIDDYIFRKELKKEILLIKVKNDCKDILKFFIDKIISIFNKYKESSTRVIYISRWI